MTNLEEARNLRKQGQLRQARALLLQAPGWHDPQLVTLTILTLNDLEDSAGLHHALTCAIAALPSLPPLSDEYLLFLHRRAEQHCLDLELRAPLFALISGRVAAGSAPLARAWNAGIKRRAFGADFHARAAQCNFIPNFIPLGLNCMPWVLTNRWAMAQPETYCRNLNPFAMAVHTIPGVSNALATDFAEYTAPDQVMTITAPSGRGVVMRKDRGATWVHHDNPYFTEHGYRNLAAGMADRIAALRAACAAPGPVFMMHYINVDYPAMGLKFLPALHRALESFAGRRDYHLFLSNTVKLHEGQQVYNVDPRTCFFYCAPPEKGFEWNLEANLDSPKSLHFEQRYIGRIEECLRRWRYLPPRNA